MLTKDYFPLDSIIEDKITILLFSVELLEEFIEVIQRRKFQKYISTTDLNELIGAIERNAKFIETKSKIKKCRDPKDDFLLDLSIDGNATYLITGDKDLLELIIIGNTEIITMSEFLKRR